MRIAVAMMLLFALMALAAASMAAEYYVAPDGKPDAPGTKDVPWDIVSALGGRREIKPGDTIWIRGGTYKHPDRTSGSSGFAVKLAGEPDKPIHVRACAGERVTIDGGLSVGAPTNYLWMWDLEVMVSENLAPGASRVAKESGSHPKDLNRPWGSVNILAGKGCKYINLVVHDNSQGIGFWRGAEDSELHGCIIYDNGWIGPDRWHGPGIYTQNQTGEKWITDNILFGNYSTTVQAYGSANAYVDHFRFEGNIAFGPRKEGGRARFLVGGGRPSRDIVVRNNLLFEVPLQLGYGAENEDCIVEGNIIVRAGLAINKFKTVVNRDNFIWKEGDPRPAQAHVFLRPNKYDKNRANLAIINWQKTPTVEVDLSTFLRPGDKFRIQRVQDFFGKPALTGVWAGKPVAVPIIPDQTNAGGEIGVFVILREPAGG